MNQLDLIIGILAGIALSFFYDLVREHQRRKRRKAYSRQAFRDRHY